ncbi:hypothetical protein Tco_0438106 [Tanacetum coccineum]
MYKDVPSIGEKVADNAQGDSETDKEESVEAMNPTPLAIKSNSVVNWKIFQQGQRSIYQIMRANRADTVYMSFGAMVKDFTIEDLIELYTVGNAVLKSDQGVLASFNVPNGAVIPFGTMELAIKENKSTEAFESLLEKIKITKLDGGELDKLCNELQNLITTNVSCGPIRFNPQCHPFKSRQFREMPFVRYGIRYSHDKSSFKAQRFAGRGILIESGVLKKLGFNGGFGSRNAFSRPFIWGLRETLASGTRGTPWRLSFEKFDGVVKTLAFANFSEEMVVAGGVADGEVLHLNVDYSKKPLTVNSVFRQQLEQRLGSVGLFLEQKFRSAQDVEGCLTDCTGWPSGYTPEFNVAGSCFGALVTDLCLKVKVELKFMKILDFRPTDGAPAHSVFLMLQCGSVSEARKESSDDDSSTSDSEDEEYAMAVGIL